MNNIDFINCFNNIEEDSKIVLSGLDSNKQKIINSKYFYDEKGSILFDQITKLDDYYPTKIECEIGILFENEGLTEANNYIETHLLPNFVKKQKQNKQPGRFSRKKSSK